MMEVQECARRMRIVEYPITRDPLAEMILRCRSFQCLVTGLDTVEACDWLANRCDSRRTLHHLDMAVQECSEAWDLLEGGWKHHKRKPRAADPVEVAMELVDVLHFVLNAYVYMGGPHEPALIAAAVAASKQEFRLPSIDYHTAWSMGERAMARMIQSGGFAPYDHGNGAWGLPWVKHCAGRVNVLRAKIFTIADTLRVAQAQMGVEKVDTIPVPGLVFIDLIPLLFSVAQSIVTYVEATEGEVNQPPVPTPIDRKTFYSTFMVKNDLNFERQARGY